MHFTRAPGRGAFECGQDRMGFSTGERADLRQYPLVLLPGFMCDGRVWEPQVRLLSRHVPVIVAPLRGAERVEEVAEGLLRHLPPRFSVLGAGLGGTVAMALLQQAAERVAAIGLVAASPLPETPAKAAEREPWIIQARAGRLRAVMQEVVPLSALAPGAMRGRVITEIADMAEALGPDVFVQQSRMLQRRSDLQAVLRRAQLPGLIICGLYDSLIPVRRQFFTAELMQNARIEMIEDAGHMPLLEQPAQVSAILLDWILQGAEMQPPGLAPGRAFAPQDASLGRQPRMLATGVARFASVRRQPPAADPSVWRAG